MVCESKITKIVQKGKNTFHGFTFLILQGNGFK